MYIIYVELLILAVVLFIMGLVFGRLQKKYSKSLTSTLTKTFRVKGHKKEKMGEESTSDQPVIIQSIFVKESLEMDDDEKEIS